jgi:hypothetical protein
VSGLRGEVRIFGGDPWRLRIDLLGPRRFGAGRFTRERESVLQTAGRYCVDEAEAERLAAETRRAGALLGIDMEIVRP